MFTFDAGTVTKLPVFATVVPFFLRKMLPVIADAELFMRVAA